MSVLWRSRRCEVVSKVASNNGMHPTDDTTAVKFIQSLGAAGDAGRYASLCDEGLIYGCRLQTREC